MHKKLILAALVSALCLGTAFADDHKEVFTAFAVNMSNVGPGAATTFTIQIDRWSSAEDRERLLKTLMDEGHDKFMDALRDEDEVGFVRGHGRVAARNPFPSTRLHFAFESVQDGERHITLVTDRPISGREAMANNRSLDYDTSAVVMKFPKGADKDGKSKGSGTMYVALKLGVDKKTGHLKVEEWANEGLRLTDITSEKK